jgi:hypothetical protein
MVNRLVAVGCATALLSTALAAAPTEGFADTPFTQETHEPLPIAKDGPANDVRAVFADRDNTVWAATRAGVFYLPRQSKEWRPVKSEVGPNPAFVVASRDGSKVLVGAWNGLFEGNTNGLQRLAEIDKPIVALAVLGISPGQPDDVLRTLAVGPDGLWRILADGSVKHEPLPCSRSVRAIQPWGPDEVFLATDMGLYRMAPGGGNYLWSVHDSRSADGRDLDRGLETGVLWAAGLGGVAVVRGTNVIDSLTPAKGLPNSAVQCLARDPWGAIWIGTQLGVARYDGKTWSLRQGPRWLVNDDVRDVDVQVDGTVWIATAGGVSAIRCQPMMLADKAKHYHAVCVARHVREPGIVEKCRLRVPGDVSTWEPEDDDNDGGYTAVYLAMESFRYAATKDPEALANAKRTFNALRFLQTVTGTPGFIARTVIPSDWTHLHDPNEEISDAEWAARRVEDPRSKRVPIRWRKSKDGRWLWKGDTSSDEITAHMFGYLFYHDLAADEAERSRVRDHVCRIVDHIVDNGYVLKDLDGAHTRWGVWAPERLNHDPDWAAEAGVNSVEILSYLKLAHHVSGAEKYQEHYLRLLNEHHYRSNVLRAKVLNPARRTHIDDDLLAFAWPALLMWEKDPALLALYRRALESWHEAVKHDHTPFFEFLYKALTGHGGNLQTSIEFLRDQPLDLVRWTVDNSRREDVRLVRVPELEEIQTDRLLPPSERGVPRTDENPWRAVQGDGGQTESDGVFWLLPYWMGRHYGFIQAPN